ncbi:MAG: UDP-glucose 4-epimerase GalE, partial [Candidatus Latescibacterota bacterium]
MAILVTGGCGYIGSATVELLLQHGEEEVVVVDNLSRGHREALPAHVPFYCGDIGDRGLLQRVTRAHALDACIHLAALAYVGESVQHPQRYYENNVEQAVALLEVVMSGGVRHVVLSSTCATYGEPLAARVDEEHPQRPLNPYGWSKFMLERILESYDRAYGLRFVGLRYFNAAGATHRIGEDRHPDPYPRLIASALYAAAGARPFVSVFGDDYPTPDGTAVRDYVHVADLAEAHVRALRYLRAGGSSQFANLGTGQGHSVLEVLEAARRVTGRPVRAVVRPRRPGDPASLVAQAQKARRLLGWSPAQSGLEEIV